MIEVRIQLRFNQHSLGDRRTKQLNQMLRDPDGRVMFMPTWWKALMRYAAQVVNRHHDAVKDIDWAPVIEGTPREYKRFYAPQKFTLHEAFFPGDEIIVHAVLPTELPIDDFKELLEVAGKYRGISPYRKDQKYGTFDVIAVTRRIRTKPK